MKKIFGVILFVIFIIPGMQVKALSVGGIEVNVVTTGDGLYADTYEEGRYIYKGAFPNNYIILDKSKIIQKYNMIVNGWSSELLFDSNSECQEFINSYPIQEEMGNEAEATCIFKNDHYIPVVNNAIVNTFDSKDTCEESKDDIDFDVQCVEANYYDDIWRIIAIESDGAVKIIRNESIGDMPYDNESRHSEFCFDGYGCGAWGSNTTTMDSNGNYITSAFQVNEYGSGGRVLALPDQESLLNRYLNHEWYNSLSNNIQNFVVNHNWNIGSIYSSRNPSDDLFAQIEKERQTQWNGKIGLITLSDFLRSNSNDNECSSYTLNVANYSKCSNTNWMYNSLIYSSPSMWLMSSTYGDDAGVLSFDDDWLFDGGHAREEKSVFPVLYLNSNVIFNGNGTSDNPYVLVEVENDNYKGKVTIEEGSSVDDNSAFTEEVDLSGNITWTSEDENIAKIENGKILGIKEGITIIRGLGEDGTTYEIEVTVIKNPITISSIYIGIGIVVIIVVATILYLYYRKRSKTLENK